MNTLATKLCLVAFLASVSPLRAAPDAHLRSPLIHVAEVKSQRVAFHLMVPEGSPKVLRAILLHAAHFEARDHGRWYRFCAENGLAHMTLTEFPSGQQRPRRIGQGIEIALRQFAEDLDRPELNHVPVLTTGFSAGGMGDPALRKFLPERHLGCANSCSWMVKWQELEPGPRRIPGLFIIGAVPDNFKMLPVIDERYRPAMAEELPYTLGLMHGCAHNFGNTATLAVPYLEALLELRLPERETPVGEPVPLRDVDSSKGWLGDYATVNGTYATISRAADYAGKPADKVWLPNRATAYTWRAWQTKDSPVDITVAAGGEVLHREFVPKKVTKIQVTAGDRITLGLNVREEGIVPTNVVFWDEDRELGRATEDRSFEFEAKTGILHVYAAYEIDGREAVTNPMQIVVHDPATAERTAKAQADKDVASAEKTLEKTLATVRRLREKRTQLRTELASGDLSEDEARKAKGALGSLGRVLEDKEVLVEPQRAAVERLRAKRDAVYAKFADESR